MKLLALIQVDGQRDPLVFILELCIRDRGEVEVTRVSVCSLRRGESSGPAGWLSPALERTGRAPRDWIWWVWTECRARHPPSNAQDSDLREFPGHAAIETRAPLTMLVPTNLGRDPISPLPEPEPGLSSSSLRWLGRAALRDVRPRNATAPPQARRLGDLLPAPTRREAAS